MTMYDSSILVKSRNGLDVFFEPPMGVRMNLAVVLDGVVKWVAFNARSFSYMLPDSMELALYVLLAAYFMLRIATQQF